MTPHTFDPDSAEKLEDPSRYRYLSRDELVAALDLAGDEEVADLGSGTGFYTRDVAPFAGTVRAVDVQPAMHEHLREAGVPDNVEVVTAGVADMPFGSGTFDAAYSTMTFHEFEHDAALPEIARVLRPDARFVVVDWSSSGDGERGPPIDARFSTEEAVDTLEANGYVVESAVSRPETFLIVASPPS